MSKSPNLNLIFLGPPGAGKGTQAMKISDKYSIPQISTGDLMREEASSGSEAGKKISEIMSSGALLPDELVVSVLLNRLGNDDCKIGYILDGFPRNVYQAQKFDSALAEHNSELSLVVGIELEDEEIVRRLANRRICKNCGASYHLEHKKPKVKGVCDRCGAKLYLRKDDTEKVIKNRLRVYHEATSPLFEFYQKRNKLTVFDGSKKIDVLFDEICDTLDKLI